MTKYLNVNETFLSVDGEVNGYGILKPSFFIRLAGCNLDCEYCDTLYAKDIDNGNLISIDDILEKYKQAGSPSKVTITGGEPLLQPNTLILINELYHKYQCRISIETNGSLPIPATYHSPFSPVSFVIDFKLDQWEKMIEGNFINAMPCDWIKFVIYNDDDFDLAKQWTNYFIKKGSKANIAFSPMIRAANNPALISSKCDWLIQKILKNKLWNVTLNVQFHKVIWPNRIKGV